MGETSSSVLDECESLIEEVIWEGERHGEATGALANLDGVIERLRALKVADDPAVHCRRQGLLASAAMRQANICRQVPDLDAAEAADRQALTAAETADDLSRGRCLLSMSGTAFASGRSDEGMDLLNTARSAFGSENGDEYRQGLGWSWILYAHVVNDGLVDADATGAVAAAARALGTLRAIGNWAGVSRASQAIATAEETLGESEAAERLRATAALHEAKAERDHR